MEKSTPMTVSTVCATTVCFPRSRSTGKERDTESGNDYFMARYYSSSMGRFMSPDWSAKEDPVPYAQLADPQSLNLYSYVRNNPMDRVDPDGHWTCTGANANGDACKAMAAIHAQNGLVVNGVDTVASDAAAKEAQQQAQNTHFASVSDWPTGAGGFHHTGIAVDSDNTQGFSTADPSTPVWERIIWAPKARMENDIDMHTKNGETAPHSYTHIPITAAQAKAIQAAIDARATNGGRYNLMFRSCAQAVESFLHAGGVSGIPHGEVFIPAALHAVMLIERASQ
jgi:RHS repeat-associated protein